MEYILSSQEYEALASRKLNADAMRDMERARDQLVNDMAQIFTSYRSNLAELPLTHQVETTRVYLDQMQEAHDRFFRTVKQLTFAYVV
jgi:hypothetical protein